MSSRTISKRKIEEHHNMHDSLIPYYMLLVAYLADTR